MANFPRLSPFQMNYGPPCGSINCIPDCQRFQTSCLVDKNFEFGHFCTKFLIGLLVWCVNAKEKVFFFRSTIDDFQTGGLIFIEGLGTFSTSKFCFKAKSYAQASY